eukprot:TRINITY_DN2392_c0_g1_i1.p2 TRINITY_DN2392_c0_g1~~TRINITY_DN2392_c0_g1_i1.p2  ORF type:complete len:469 (+),score=93.80 TRINITY_DN2392_c0_g1_i1:2175-3581(+)
MVMLCSHLSPISGEGSQGYQPPFSQVLLHPMVRDRDGRKMSKSLGNVIDPMHVIDGVSLDTLIAEVSSGNITDPVEVKRATKVIRKEYPSGIPVCGADALRLALLTYLQQHQSINMDIQRIISCRQFGNKLWNASRFVFMQLDALEPNRPVHSLLDDQGTSLTDIVKSGGLSMADRYILSRLAHTTSLVCQGFELGKLHQVANAAQSFALRDLCDIYIESVKGKQDSHVGIILVTVLDAILRLLHPVTPYITEELWQRLLHYDYLSPSLSKDEAALMTATYPTPSLCQSLHDPQVEHEMTLFQETLSAIRRARADLRSQQRTVDGVTVHSQVPTTAGMLRREHKDLCRLSRLSNIEITEAEHARSEARNQEKQDHDVLFRAVNPSLSIAVASSGGAREKATLSDEEVEALLAKQKRLELDVSKLQNRLSSPQFTAKAPQHVVEAEAARLQKVQAQLGDVQAKLARHAA